MTQEVGSGDDGEIWGNRLLSARVAGRLEDGCTVWERGEWSYVCEFKDARGLMEWRARECNLCLLNTQGDSSVDVP
jgi:hypothetical protein